ncbi:CD0519/CD1768 family membrane protein [Parendozoicomonas haliclonae]|uniref:Nucleoside recognition n=1 Tax=Parendozoicomonas haliclonae TaxID=1960125 RepID=A0A1X7AFG3_9GAMM|nr:nucleoside recognition domain-containing protein [Parendozoicomonas haliclonae]SMA35890.1 Nucleoside recognition [Parendozoicomonas haliclonae]
MNKLSTTAEQSTSSLGRRLEPFILLAALSLFFGYIGSTMGVANMFNTLFKTAHDLLLNTVFFIMGITVLTGAFSRVLVEFGLISILEKLLAPLMRPIFNLPGRSALAALMTFFSDNPAIISLATDRRFNKGFKAHELFSLTNFGTAFGMGMLVITFMSTQDLGTGESSFMPALIGLGGALVGGIMSTRLMQFFCKPVVGDQEIDIDFDGNAGELLDIEQSVNPQDSAWLRLLNAMLDGGKAGVGLGMAIIPGVLVISSIVMMLTFGPSANGYTGAAYEGVALLPALGNQISWLLSGLFGFQHAELIAFPVTSLGAVGAAMSTLPHLIAQGMITGNEIAVFTAMGMCWSGYLSTHTAMMDTLKRRDLTSKALLAHTIGGLSAGVAAHYLYLASQLI